MASLEDRRNKLCEMVDEGIRLMEAIGHLPTFSEYGQHRKKLDLKFSEWQIYRKFGGHRGAWSAYQYQIMEREHRRLTVLAV